jgi:cyanophycinase
VGKNHKGGSAVAQRVARARNGSLIVIGGGEDKKRDMLILRDVARRVNSGALAVATVATRLANELWSDYEKVFHRLGVKRVVHLAVENREEAVTEEKVHVLDNVNVVFFTGGDQLKITSKLGGTRIHDRIQEIYNCGGTIAGTSAGASVLSETMLVSGPGNETNRIGQDLFMAPGFGFAKDMIIDQHFAERGRIGRLLGAVARNPRLLGVGIDEDTAIVMDGKEQFQVIGSGGVYVLDGHRVNFTNISEEESGRAISIFGIRLDVLSQGDLFDIKTRQPSNRFASSIDGRAQK